MAQKRDIGTVLTPLTSVATKGSCAGGGCQTSVSELSKCYSALLENSLFEIPPSSMERHTKILALKICDIKSFEIEKAFYDFNVIMPLWNAPN